MSDIDTSMGVAEGPSPADQLCERLFGSAIGFTEILSVYLGDRLGLYQALRSLGSATSSELAAQAGIAERYAREWLEHEATAGLLVVADPADDATARRFRLPEGCADSLTDPEDLANILPLARALVAIARQIDPIVNAFRSGGGVPYAVYGQELVEAQAAMNRPVYRHLLAEWLATVPDVHARLTADPPARIADIACGAAWSSIALARAYPQITVDGFDSDEASARLGAQNVAAADLGARVRVEPLAASQVAGDRRYDLVTIFEAVHDMARPVEALRHVRELVGRDGAVIVMDENVGENFDTPGGLDPFFYAASFALCLPAALAETGSVGTGAVMRHATLDRYAREAGFSGVDILPIEHPFFRLYRLRP